MLNPGIEVNELSAISLVHHMYFLIRHSTKDIEHFYLELITFGDASHFLNNLKESPDTVEDLSQMEVG